MTVISLSIQYLSQTDKSDTSLSGSYVLTATQLVSNVVVVPLVNSRGQTMPTKETAVEADSAGEW